MNILEEVKKRLKAVKEGVGDVEHVMHASYTLNGKKQESTHYSSAKNVKDAHQEVGMHLYNKGARNIMTTHKSTRLGIGAVSHPKPAPKLSNGSNDNTPSKKKTNVIDFKAVKARLGSKS
jgi:hypothetical protein